jgi:WD40 repeat protein
MPIDPAKAKVRTTYPHAGTLYGLALDPAAGRLYAGSDDYAVHVFDLAGAKKEPVARWTKHDNYVSALACVTRASKPLVVSGGYDRRLVWWDGAGQPLRSVEAHQGWVRDLAPLRDGELLVSCGDDMLVKLWETDSGRLVRTFEGHPKETPQGHVTALYVVAVSPDGKHVAGGDRIGTVIVWEVDSGKAAATFDVPVLYTYDPKERKRSIGGIRSLAFSPDGVHLAVGGIGRVGNVDGLAGAATVEVWDWRKPQRRFTAEAQAHKGIVNDLLFHPDGWLIGAGGGSDNGFVAFWKADKIVDAPANKKDAVPAQRAKADGHAHRLRLSRDGTELYAAGYRKLDVWALTG